MRYMLDTNICIYAIKHKPREVIERLKEHNPSEICISSVTYAELIHGVEKSKAVDKNRIALTLLLTDIGIREKRYTYRPIGYDDSRACQVSWLYCCH